jgi:uncharacterized membrane protein
MFDLSSIFSSQTAWMWVMFVGFVMIVSAYISISKYAGSKDDWNQIQGEMTGAIVMTFIGVLAFIIGMIIMVNYSGGDTTTKMFYSMIAVSGLSLFVSTISLCVSVVSA